MNIKRVTCWGLLCCGWLRAVLLVAVWLSVLSPVGGLRDEDQYLLRHSSPALEQDSPCGQLLLLTHLEGQDKDELACPGRETAWRVGPEGWSSPQRQRLARP